MENENATSNHPVLSAIYEEVAKLKAENKNLWDSLGMLSRNVELLEDWVKEAVEVSQIDFDTATEIAEIFGFNLTQEVEVEMTFKVSATFTVPVGTDADSLVGDFGITENPIGLAEEYLDNSSWELDDWNITS